MLFNTGREKEFDKIKYTFLLFAGLPGGAGRERERRLKDFIIILFTVEHDDCAPAPPPASLLDQLTVLVLSLHHQLSLVPPLSLPGCVERER